MPRTLLITGATGTVSRALREALPPTGPATRLLVRDPAAARRLAADGADVAVGDLGDPRSLPAAFDGVDDLWLLVPNGPSAPEHSANALWAARQADVERVVRLSVIGAAGDAPPRSARLHALSDAELQASGLRWTILRPAWFMQNLLGAADAVRRGTLAANMGAGRLGMVDARDIADVAARVLADEPARHHGLAYTLTGPEALSFADVAERLAAVAGHPVAYRPIADDAQRAAYLELGLPAWIADMLVEYGRAYADGWSNHTTDDVARISGREPRSLETFLRDHAAAF